MARTQLLLDRYQIIEQAGTGGYGTVQHAYDTWLKRDVAIKYIELSEADVARAHLLAMEAKLRSENEREEADEREGADEPLPWEDDPEYLDPAYLDDDGVDVDADFDDADNLFDHIPGLEEARTVAKLSDANIVTVYECEVHGATAYVFMEYVEGKTLAQIMREVGDDISLDIIAAVFASVAHALEVAHDSNVLHLDIKPENVIVNKKGVVKVTDFGLATLMDGSGQGTAGGGTIGYMPLEQMRQEPLDVRSDEWALASLAYEMLSGSNPFRARTLREAENAIEQAELVLPSLCWDALSAEADDIVFTALDPDPDERYETVAEFAEELSPLLGNAKAGKRALANLVNEVEPEEEPAPRAPREPLPPLVDRLGPTGAAVLARIFSVAATVMMGAVALVNVRLSGTAAMFGVATDYPVAFWVLLAALAVLAAVRPAFGVLGAYVVFGVALVWNHAYWGLALLVLAGIWWWRVGRRSDGASLAVLMQPLCGSFGMGAFASVLAGALLDVREALAACAFSVISALAFASLGSGSLLGWDVAANALMPANPDIGGVTLTNALVETVGNVSTWCVAASWIVAGFLFALCCTKGTRAFDVVGSVLAAAALVVGVVLAACLNAVTPDALSLVGALVPGFAGIVLAALSVPDRVRLAEGEW